MKPMKLTVTDVQAIVKDVECLEGPWHDRVVALAQDWIEMMKEDMGQLQRGVALAKALEAGGQTVAQLEVIEEILRLPLCRPCRELIGGKVAE